MGIFCVFFALALAEGMSSRLVCEHGVVVGGWLGGGRSVVMGFVVVRWWLDAWCGVGGVCEYVCVGFGSVWQCDLAGGGWDAAHLLCVLGDRVVVWTAGVPGSKFSLLPLVGGVSFAFGCPPPVSSFLISRRISVSFGFFGLKFLNLFESWGGYYCLVFWCGGRLG